MDCIFCKIDKNRKIIAQNDLSLAFYDEFPVSRGHTLIIPKRHVADFFDLSSDEKKSIFDLISECKTHIDKEYNPDGYNIGVNIGEAAGQSVFHVHIHLIPRYYGDIENPRGGVRGVLPEFRNY
jgi:diadenosine tetraphosphate (Ap4A) HIT family hydrolase